jgi:hypothetical protein
MIINWKKNGAIDISFGWIFALIVGGTILFLAIFGVFKFTNIQNFQQNTETSKSIDSLLNPIESGYETGQKVILSSTVDTRIYTQCVLDNGLGKQKIQTSQKSFNEWSNIGSSITSLNKYIFSKSPAEDKTFIIFSKSYELPSEESYEFSFKVADLIYLIPQSEIYCFINAPKNIEEEINNLNINNILLDECSSQTTKVCFEKSGDCDIIVNYDEGAIDKDSKRLYFETDALMYAAIFSDKENYECQLKRIIKRAEQLSSIYQEKSRIEKIQGCEGNIENELIKFNELLKNFEDSKDIFIIGEQAKILNKLNSKEGVCKLW